jgi:pyruvate/2-oxoglutarate dehydrogenase complex dihydrolipoamide dehydrogenase (E3) component
MSEIEHHGILVIGSGEAGKQLTWNLAQSGHRTAVVERKYIGGSCPNIACLPSKNVIWSANANWFMLKCLVTKVREFLNRPTDVRYTSAPLWRPWRDF